MSTILDQDVAAFETHRRALIGLAYRMLGSRAEADDIVQDAYLRWHAADRATIEQPRHYLGTVVTRLCLDRMKSARARREIYVGQWLRNRWWMRHLRTIRRLTLLATFPLR